MKNSFKKAELAVLAAVAPAYNALAQFTSKTLDQTLDQVNTTIGSKTTIGKYINIATGIVFIVAIGLIAWGYASRGKGDNQSNDKMINAGIYAIIAVALIQVFKLLLGAS